MKGLEELFVVGWMLFGIYIEVFIMILADLWSGLRKAKQRITIQFCFILKKDESSTDFLEREQIFVE